MQIIALIITISALGQADVGTSATAQYALIMKDYVAALRNSEKVPAKARLASEQFNARLDKFIHAFSMSSSPRLTSSDYYALSEAASRLKRFNEALHFARLSADDAYTLNPFIALVRCHCALGQAEEAEGAIREGNTHFPEADKRYLLHNIIALKYRALHREHKAYAHLARTCELLSDQIERGPFYATHLAHCVDQLAMLASRTGNQAELSNGIQGWKALIGERLESSIRASRSDNGTLALSDEALKRVSLEEQALIALSIRLRDGSEERHLADWAALLKDCEIPHDTSMWHGQIGALCQSIQTSLSPQLDGAAVGKELRELLPKVSGVEGKIGTGNSEKIADALNTALEVLLQHQRCRILRGRELERSWAVQEGPGPQAARFEILHIYNPYSKEARQGLESLQTLRQGELARPWLKVSVASVQVGVAWDPERRRLYRHPSQSLEDEKNAINQARESIGIAKTIDVLPRESEAYRLLDPKCFPLNILLDRESRIICVLGGPEPVKLRRLIELTEQPL